ncbi:MAG: hypothetical protein QXI33_03635 [Candidatus Pacearchaeota archaeon]
MVIKKILGKKKKAQTFTIMALALIFLLMITAGIITKTDNRRTIQKRVSTLDTFLFSVEENLERQMYIAGFRTVFLTNDQITKTGQYIDVIKFFNESIFNGSVNGEAQQIMIGATFNDSVYSINEKAKKIGAIVEFSNVSIKISQDDPWNIKISLNVSIKMKDKTNLAEWEKEKIIVTYIPITGFEDPVYIVNTNSRITHKINKTIYEGQYNSPISNLLEHTQKGYYTENTDAPSFLKRLEGDLSASPYGIESLVDLSALSQQGLPTQTKSVVDHIYFNSTNNPSSSQIAGMPTWFRLDNAHKPKYNL